jgi:hypothetical protein
MAVTVRGGQVSGVIMHTDQGSELEFKEYTCTVRAACGRLGVRQSMGRPGSYDNALAESVSGLFKTELVGARPDPKRCAAPRLVRHVAHQRTVRGAGLRYGAGHQWAQRRTDTLGATRRARTHRQRTRGSGQRPRSLGSGPDRRDGQRRWTTCKCGNSHGQKWPFRRAGWCPGGKSHWTDDAAICAGD